MRSAGYTPELGSGWCRQFGVRFESTEDCYTKVSLGRRFGGVTGLDKDCLINRVTGLGKNCLTGQATGPGNNCLTSRGTGLDKNCLTIRGTGLENCLTG
ncbi:hypothetical protein B296_00047479 [Ensete ventricosum]|uniref:Uncharacterized protein n=1 Tax=Ensete ventricosum TaxID=4639 RepID=A0A426WYK9_ENSVE|nr:hypothetical protein B296_00047479 [Ensete ventricosum]